jgi:hypothetical protein
MQLRALVFHLTAHRTGNNAPDVSLVSRSLKFGAVEQMAQANDAIDVMASRPS